MDLFIVDNRGESDLLNKNEFIDESIVAKIFDGTRKEIDENRNAEGADDQSDGASDSDSDYGNLPKNTIDLSHIIELPATKQKTKTEIEMEKFSKVLNAIKDAKLSTKEGKCCLYDVDDEDDETFAKTNIKTEMKTSTTKSLEQQKSLANPSDKTKARLSKIERSKSKGKNWFDLPATEMTEEVKRDLEAIQMRSVLDPKHFYKKNDLKVLPKYFQVGTVLPSPLDYYNERGERKTKKKTLVDELMADAEFQRYNKRKYRETIAEKNRSGGYYKANKKMKKLKKK